MTVIMTMSSGGFNLFLFVLMLMGTSLVRMTMISVVVIVIMSWSLMEDFEQDQVEAQTEDSCDHHNLAVNVVLNEASLQGLNKQPDGKCQQENNRCNGSNDLRSMPSE